MEVQVLGTRNLHDALERLAESEYRLESSQYAALLKECATTRDLTRGKRVHSHISKHGGFNRDRDTFVGNYLVHMYGRCGSLDEARKVFDQIRLRNVYSCNIMIAALAENGHLREAKSLFDNTSEKNVVTWNAMIDGFIREKQLERARCLFDEMPERNVVSWSSMIEAYAENGELHRALLTFKLMDLEGVRPNRVTYIIVLEACADLELITAGVLMHGLIRECGLDSDIKVRNTLIHMYGCCGRLSEAKSIFEQTLQKSTVSWNAMVAAYAQNGDLLEAKSLFNRMPERDVVSWNALMTAYSQNGEFDQALELYRLMECEPNPVTFVIVVDACANVGALETGKELHSKASVKGFDRDIRVGNVLLKLYGKSGCLEQTKAMFHSMELRNTISWTKMIAAYEEAGEPRRALQTFREMDQEGIKPDSFTYVTVLDACTSASALNDGREIHSRAAAEGYSSDTVLNNALMNLFAKCGSLVDAEGVFDEIEGKDDFSMNSIISMYAANGCGEEAVEFLKVMSLEGMEPNSITFMSILSACSHSGLLDLAWDCFPFILGDYGVTPEMDHYVILLDMLARAGRMEEALDLITNMPYEPSALAWTVLLGACNTHGKIGEPGGNAAENVMKLEPENPAAYLLLSNIAPSLD